MTHKWLNFIKPGIIASFALFLTLSPLSGFGQQSPEQILESLRNNGAKDEADAQFLLGQMYFAGWSVGTDYAEAAKWWQLAAAQGSAGAQNGLGVLYEYGLGVVQDYSRAKEWYGRACDNGLPRGCDNYRKLKEPAH